MALGDSKTADIAATPPTQTAWIALATTGNYRQGWAYGKGGSTVADWNSTYGALALAKAARDQIAGSPDILVNLGVNDLTFVAPGTLPNQATWEANYLAVLDAIHAQYPNSLIYLTLVWKQNFDANCDTLDSWITTDIIPARAWLRQGDDERTWFKPNVATYSTDGVHQDTAAGQAGKVSAVKTVLGY